MIDVCWGCGEFTPERRIREETDATAVAVCPDCGHEHPFPYRPLVAVCGPSGAGKTTVLRRLFDRPVAGRVLPLELDLLWDGDVGEYVDRCLRLARAVGRAGRPVALFGAGLWPGNVESSRYRRYFPDVQYLALVAGEPALRERLADRPDWRGTDPEFVAEQAAYDRALRERAGDDPRLTVVDTADRDVEATVDRVAARVTAAVTGAE